MCNVRNGPHHRRATHVRTQQLGERNDVGVGGWLNERWNNLERKFRCFLIRKWNTHASVTSGDFV